MTFCVYCSNQRRYTPADHRYLALLAYLSQMLTSDLPADAGLHGVKPYKVPWNSVAVHVCHTAVPNSQIMYALNGSVVALCSAPEDKVNYLSQTFVISCTVNISMVCFEF